MNKKKRFNISNSLNKGFEETISIVENDEKMYRNVTIPINRIVKDPNNPRKVFITAEDIQLGLRKEDVHYKVKEKELEKILELAESIKESGLIQPIVVYKQLEKYCVVAGERRFLACIAAEKTEIEARILQKQPTELELKLIQWFENNEREDLSLYERINNLKAIYEAIPSANLQSKVSMTLLQQVTKLSKAQASAYAAILNGYSDVMDAIQHNIVTNLDKAVLINNCPQETLRREAIELAKKGISYTNLKSFLSSQGLEKDPKRAEKNIKKQTKISLGHTSNPHVVKTIINAVIAIPPYHDKVADFKKVDWQDNGCVADAFIRLLNLLELHS